MTYGEVIARQMTGINRYAIAVIEEKTKAKQLYERMGFSTDERHSSKLLKLFTGVACTYKME